MVWGNFIRPRDCSSPSKDAMPLSIAEKLKLKLEHEILMFNLKPGERLDETRLAERYGTSRTPVREALRLLAAEGLVKIRAHRGAVVARLSITELVEIFEMMAVYEGVCARLAAQRASSEELSLILIAHERCRQQCEANDYDGYCMANAHFHEALYQASHNSYLIKQTVSTRNRLAAYRRFQLRRNNRLKESFQEHEAVVQAVRNGQGDEADRLMREHISVQGSHIASLIASLPADYFAEPAKPQTVSPLLRPHSQIFPAAALVFE
jgi:DNA-binding GntR family transcriptional regulator